MIAQGPHKVRAIDTFLVLKTASTEHPGKRHTVGGSHIRPVYDALELRMLLRCYDHVDIADTNVTRLSGSCPLRKRINRILPRGCINERVQDAGTSATAIIRQRSCGTFVVTSESSYQRHL